jgi:hypothetical protein
MESTPTANQIRGRAIGATFFSGFGAIWLGLALYVRQQLNTTTITLLVIGASLLLLACLWLSRQADRWLSVPEDPACSRTFKRVNAAQWIAIAIVAFSFSRLHIDVYVISAITAIVGIHMFPLARLFRYPMHNLTGAALALWASATVLLVSTTHLQGITALGTGIILWTSAATTLIMATAITRRATPPTSATQNNLCL